MGCKHGYYTLVSNSRLLGVGIDFNYELGYTDDYVMSVANFVIYRRADTSPCCSLLEI
jgi:hypothetical protein